MNMIKIMKKTRIRYNISSNKRIHYGQFFLYCLVIAALSLLFLALGVNNLSIKDKQLREEKKRQDFYRSQLDDMKKKTQEYNQVIQGAGRKWRGQVNFCNALISIKNINVIDKLNVLEEMLPGGVYLKSVILRADAAARIDVTVVADSYPNLFEVYKNFSKYDPIILNETEDEGIFEARMSVNIKAAAASEKKENENKNK
jgi:Tfp pilus assembly protein PilN